VQQDKETMEDQISQDSANNTSKTNPEYHDFRNSQVPPNDDTTRERRFAAVQSLVSLADVNPATVIPLFEAGGLVLLREWYDRFEPLWNPAVSCRVNRSFYVFGLILTS